MNAARDPDAILAAWLDDGPSGSPSHAPLDRGDHPNDPSTRRPMWVPWRSYR